MDRKDGRSQGVEPEWQFGQSHLAMQDPHLVLAMHQDPHFGLAKHKDLHLGLAKHQDLHLVLVKHQDPHLGPAKHEDTQLGLAKHQDPYLGLAKHEDRRLGLAKHQDSHLDLAKHEDAQLVHLHKTWTAEVTICIISEKTARSPSTVTERLRSWTRWKTFITNRELCCALRTTQHSRVCLSHAAVTHSCVNFRVNRNPEAPQGTSEN